MSKHHPSHHGHGGQYVRDPDTGATWPVDSPEGQALLHPDAAGGTDKTSPNTAAKADKSGPKRSKQ